MNLNNIGDFFAPSSIILMGLAGFAAPTLAATTSLTNPCQPSQRSSKLPVLVSETTTVDTLQPLTSPVEPTPIGTVQLQAGKVNVQLKNMTDTDITYQAIGHTQQRTLVGQTDLVLRDLPAPVTITFLRPDAGFVRVTMVANPGSDILVLVLDEATGLNDSQISVRVQSNGNVLSY
jgi:hypothetical protein